MKYLVIPQNRIFYKVVFNYLEDFEVAELQYLCHNLMEKFYNAPCSGTN